MAWTATDLQRIDSAIASGVLRVRTQDREITYQSIQALKDARTEISLYLSSQAQAPIRQLRIFTDKGF